MHEKKKEVARWQPRPKAPFQGGNTGSNPVGDAKSYQLRPRYRLQQVPVAFQSNPNELAASTHLGLGKQLLQSILDRTFGNLHV